jgi:hypothetical protein
MGPIELPRVARLINWVVFPVIFMDIHFLIELAKLHIVFLIVKFAYVKSQAAIILASRENLHKTFTLFSCNLNSIFMQ